jgi:Flp pilus assembly protein TadD
VAGEVQEDSLIIGHRLMQAEQYELALAAYTRAAGEQGLNIDTLSALGSVNLRLGRLGQAERLMRRAVAADPTFAPALNNLGVILMERGKNAEAAEVFRRAFATDSGNSDEIRDNLRLALARLENSSYVDPQENVEFQLVQAGTPEFEALTAP